MNCTPRVNSAKLNEHGGKTVRIIGKVLKLEGDTALLEASDQGQVTIRLNRDSHFADEYVEVIGRVSSEDNSIQEFTSINMGSKIDMGLVEAVVQLTAQFPHLFPQDG